jgi:hypothetical protein
LQRSEYLDFAESGNCDLGEVTKLLVETNDEIVAGIKRFVHAGIIPFASQAVAEEPMARSASLVTVSTSVATALT